MFSSTALDHLPCDIVRSVWLLQSLNFEIDKSTENLESLIRSNPDRTQVVGDIVRLKLLIRRLSAEAVEECKYLKMCLGHHRKILIDDAQTMNKLVRLREENLFKNNKKNFTEFKRQFLQQLRDGKENSYSNGTVLDPSRKTRSTVVPLKVKKSEPLKVKIKVVDKSSRGKILSNGKASARAQKVPIVKVEPIEVYCYCRQGDSGRMIACDNPKCKIEWFHYKCVGIKLNEKAPAKWFCRDCAQEMQFAKKKKKRDKPHKVDKAKPKRLQKALLSSSSSRRIVNSRNLRTRK